MSAAAKHLEEYRRTGKYSALRTYALENAHAPSDEVIEVLSAAVNAHAGAEWRTGVLSLLLPCSETKARKAHGLNTYSADSADEPPFRFSASALDAFLSAASEWVNASPDNDVARFFAAQALHAKGDLAGGQRALDFIRPRAGDQQIAAAHLAGDWFADLDKAADDFSPLDVSRLPRRPGPRVFLGCDTAFHQKYGRWLRRSVEAQGFEVHLHLYGGAAGAAETVDDLRFPFEPKLYYAAGRLIRLYQLMCVDPRPTVLLDADLLCTGGLPDLFERLAQHDIALCRMPGRLPFHTQVNASVFGVMPTAGGMAYLRRVAGYIAKIFASGKVPWCLDQLSLHCVFREMRSRQDGPGAVAVGPAIYDGTSEAYMWPQKVGPLEPGFAKLQAAYAALEARDGATS